MDFYRLLPSYWIQNSSTSVYWDRELNKLLDFNSVEILSEYRVKIGGVEVWVKNFPYAYGSPTNVDVLPKVKTRKRLQEAVIKALIVDGQGD